MDERPPQVIVPVQSEIARRIAEQKIGAHGDAEHRQTDPREQQAKIDSYMAALHMELVRDREMQRQQREPAIEPLRRSVTTMERPRAFPFILPRPIPPDPYLEMAAAVGINSGPVMAARIGRFFVDNGWPTYNYDRVVHYLWSLCQRDEAPPSRFSRDPFMRPWDGPTWLEPFWVPFRRCDKALKIEPLASASKMAIADRTYLQAMPLHAVEKVQAMETRFRTDSLKFVVSEIQRVPDPFLAVYAEGTPIYVIDVWDEPGFGC